MAAAPAPTPALPAPIDALPRTPATALKTLGWRGVMQSVSKQGSVLVTNHDRPEAVILSVETYEALLGAAEQARRQDTALLETLRARFDERLAALREDDAADRLRAVMDTPARLRGKVRAGATH